MQSKHFLQSTHLKRCNFYFKNQLPVYQIQGEFRIMITCRLDKLKIFRTCRQTLQSPFQVHICLFLPSRNSSTAQESAVYYLKDSVFSRHSKYQVRSLPISALKEKYCAYHFFNFLIFFMQNHQKSSPDVHLDFWIALLLPLFNQSSLLLWQKNTLH